MSIDSTSVVWIVDLIDPDKLPESHRRKEFPAGAQQAYRFVGFIYFD